MSINKNQAGFTLVEVLLLIIVVVLIAFAGWYVWDSNKSKQNSAKSDSSQTRSDNKQEVKDPTSGWKEYTNPEGKFTLKYPTSWVTATNPQYCSEGMLLLGANSESVGKCGSDNGGQMAVYSFDVESGPLGLTEEYYDDIKTEAVVADGVKGEKQSGSYSYSGEGIGFPKGSKHINYIFKTNGLIYKATYMQLSSYPDVQKEFDLVVTKTLRFN